MRLAWTRRVLPVHVTELTCLLWINAGSWQHNSRSPSCNEIFEKHHDCSAYPLASAFYRLAFPCDLTQSSPLTSHACARALTIRVTLLWCKPGGWCVPRGSMQVASPEIRHCKGIHGKPKCSAYKPAGVRQTSIFKRPLSFYEAFCMSENEAVAGG